MSNARVDQQTREAFVISNPNARVDGLYREAWVTLCQPPTSLANFNYVCSFPLTSGSLYSVALDANGILWSSALGNEFLMEPLATNIIPGSYMVATTEDDVLYMCFSNLLNGTDIPRQYNPQPAVGTFTLDRISQVGPGAPPTFNATTSTAASQAPITSWAGSGGVVTFQAVNSFTAGEVVSLSGFAVSTFFNGLLFSVLGTGLSGSQFEVAYSSYTGGSDSGVATPQYGYPISHITQLGSQPFNGQIALWSSGPGQTSSGTVWTFYYGSRGSAADPNLTNAFNSGEAVYVYIVGSPFGNGTQLVTSIGAGAPPGESPLVNFFTCQATSSSYQKVGSPSGGGNTGTYEQTIATVVTSLPIPNVVNGDEITISGATPGGWNNTWTIVDALNAGVYAIVQTSMANGTATYSWEWSGTSAAVAPTAGQLVTVLQTLNGNGIFNVTDAVIASVSGGPSSGTFTINSLGTNTQNIPAVAEQGQAETAGTSFQIDPGAVTLGTTSNPIYGQANNGIVGVAGANTSVSPGTRQAVVFFETRNGLKTQCSIPVTFTTSVASTYLLADNVPIGPPNVIRRWIAFTTAGPNGIAGPNFYTIDDPVSFTVNNQTFLYSATYIDDNISTSAKFTFTDAVLIAGDEIDVLGNDLFSQIDIGSSAWNIAYAQRMFYGLEQNKVLNFTNMSFDGGYLPNPGGSITPLGWNVDLLTNNYGPAVATITGWSVSAAHIIQQIPPMATFSAVNNFTVGISVVISGLSIGTQFNGVEYIVVAVTPTTFTVDTVGGAIAFTSDSGSATPLGSSSGSLIPSPIFGNSLYINNLTSSTQAGVGMFTQGAYQDGYNVPIILPDTLYSVRVAASCPSGKTVGNLVIDLTGSNIGLASGTGNATSYGTTYGSFVLPFSKMTTSILVYSGTLLTSPFLTGVPVGLLLRVWASNIAAGNDVLVDRIEIFPTATPLLATNVRVSYVDNFEAFDANTGNIGLAAHNTQACYGAFEMHDQLYFLQSASMQSTQDVPGIEPSNPGGGWAVHEVSNRVGACGIHAYDYGEEWVLTACRNGVYGFNGGQPIRIDFQQREIWELINWNYGQTIWLANDLPNSRILVGVPLPTPNRWLPLAPTNANPTSPNVVLMWNYQNLDTFEEIVSGRGVHTTMFGTLAAVDMRLKMSIWQITSPYAGFVTQPDGLTETLTICNGLGNEKIYQLSANQLSDDGVAINSFYATFGFVDASKAKENPLLGLARKTYSSFQALIAGSGTATFSLYPNYILNPKTFAFNPDAYEDTPRTLVQAPSDDYWTTCNAQGQRVFVGVETNAVGSSFRLSKFILTGTISPMAVNPNS
jgi:hypothetical protein